MLKDVERIVAVVFDKIISSLAAGERVEFRGFGAFSIRKRTPRVAFTHFTITNAIRTAADSCKHRTLKQTLHIYYQIKFFRMQ